ncbi:AAA family ATPase [Sorangium sp. So ce1151]|uniref:AAA family ATPase n=1 Tax=Sorangium sp. So ce1151 TaxID=3133332 RepID=UPI003F63317E
MTDEADRELLRAVLDHVLKNDAFPSVEGFLRKHASDEPKLKELIARDLLKDISGRYYLTLAGLRACDTAEARQQLAWCQALLPALQMAWRKARGSFQYAPDLYAVLGVEYNPEGEYGVPLGFLMASGLISADLSENTGIPDENINLEGLLYIEELDVAGHAEKLPPSMDLAGAALLRVELAGYRPFDRFSADLGSLTVMIGANATGKSSLFDFLRFVSFAAQNPLPPEIDPRNAGKLLFHAGGPDRLSFALNAGRREAPASLRYEVEIHGPVGAPRVVRERLVLDGHAQEQTPPPLLDFRGGRGVVRDLAVRPGQASWTVPPNELALRRAIAPDLPTPSQFQSFVASWRFYPGFDVSPAAPLRRPVHVEENPVLAEDGGNLSAVLHALVLEHREAWEELETHLGATLPGFLSLGVKSRAKGMTIAVLRERGISEELTLAELSDGTLRLLGWLALAVSPSLPPLICIDEPEIGLHPRVLPVLAGAFRLAAARSQILIATHSPHFLAQFALEEIAVMRKEEGRAVFVRPATSQALRREVEEIGGEALARLFLTEELEVLP